MWRDDSAPERGTAAFFFFFFLIRRPERSRAQPPGGGQVSGILVDPGQSGLTERRKKLGTSTCELEPGMYKYFASVEPSMTEDRGPSWERALNGKAVELAGGHRPAEPGAAGNSSVSCKTGVFALVEGSACLPPLRNRSRESDER